ncbi:protein NO VEIN domain-containing protein [Gracilimonas sp.]|uniref:protein NO VEIN domain-containing protein n=1 Tax=Gracilimonas sp. TaxID=1974203 RepID=UPI00375245A5
MTHFNEHSQEIHIEVKTTSKNNDEPFLLTLNERDYLEMYPESYFIYRVFNFNRIEGKGIYFRISGNELSKKAEFNPVKFEVSITSE